MVCSSPQLNNATNTVLLYKLIKGGELVLSRMSCLLLLCNESRINLVHRLCGLVVSVEGYTHTEVPGSIPGHSLGFF
jgi:hypothetical protein